MDKLMDNPWFLRVVALLLAVLLYTSVNLESQNSVRTSDGSVPPTDNTETISDIEVQAFYDTENLVVTGIPETVNVTIQGPKSVVQPTKALRNFEVIVDLSDAQIGLDRVPVQIRGISDKLKVTIDPSYVEVSIQEKITKEFRVEAEYNRSLIKEGYVAGKPEVEPSKVKITGAKDVIERISYVKATIDIRENIDKTITREASIRVLDRELNKLDVLVEPEIVEVKLPIKSVTKTVPIEIEQKGTLPDGISIESIELDQKEATIIVSDEELIDEIENVRVQIDVSQLTANKELTLPVIISEGIIKVTPETVKATIKVIKDEQKSLSDIPVEPIGLQNEYDLSFVSPENGSMSVNAIGPSNLIEKLQNNDIKISIDVSTFKTGTYTVNVNAKGPDGIQLKPELDTVKVIISEKEEA